MTKPQRENAASATSLLMEMDTTPSLYGQQVDAAPNATTPMSSQ